MYTLARRADVHRGKLTTYLNGNGELRTDVVNRLLAALRLRIVDARTIRR